MSKKVTTPKSGGGGLSKTNESQASKAKLDASTDSDGKSSKKILAFDEMPGNNKNRKKPIRKPEPIPEPVKEPEPVIILPAKAEKVKEKTIIKEEAKIVYIPKTKEILKHLKIKKNYPKNDEYDTIFINLQDSNLSTKFFKPKLLNKKLGDDGRLLDNPFDPTSEDSFVKIEIPLTIVQKDVMPERPPFIIENRISFSINGRMKYESETLLTDDFCIEAIRVFKAEYDDTDYEDTLEEVRDLINYIFRLLTQGISKYC